ncbi:MAG: hypothetical protein FWF57_05810 [Defluviitaleaceae bacterium]|nr:hypothetical protein [Defluviitaleaceae bacterium]
MLNFTFVFDFEENFNYKINFFGKNLSFDNFKKPKKNRKIKKSKKIKKNSKNKKHENLAFENTNIEIKNIENEKPKINSENIDTEELIKQITNTKKDSKLKIFQKINNFFYKIKNRIFDIKKMFDDIQTIYNKFKNYHDKDDIIKYTKKFFEKFIKSLKPRKIDLNMEVGIGAYETGILLAVIAIILPKLSYNVVGNFERTMIKGNFYIDGRIRIIKIVTLCVNFYLKKPIRKLIKSFITREKQNIN